jgi:hypothetical protein
MRRIPRIGGRDRLIGGPDSVALGNGNSVSADGVTHFRHNSVVNGAPHNKDRGAGSLQQRAPGLAQYGIQPGTRWPSSQKRRKQQAGPAEKATVPPGADSQAKSPRKTRDRFRFGGADANTYRGV